MTLRQEVLTETNELYPTRNEATGETTYAYEILTGGLAIVRCNGERITPRTPTDVFDVASDTPKRENIGKGLTAEQKVMALKVVMHHLYCTAWWLQCYPEVDEPAMYDPELLTHVPTEAHLVELTSSSDPELVHELGLFVYTSFPLDSASQKGLMKLVSAFFNTASVDGLIKLEKIVVVPSVDGTPFYDCSPESVILISPETLSLDSEEVIRVGDSNMTVEEYYISIAARYMTADTRTYNGATVYRLEDMAADVAKPIEVILYTDAHVNRAI